MSQFCPRCRREVVWGVTENTEARIALNAWAEARYIFVYEDKPIVRCVPATWTLHECNEWDVEYPPSKEDRRR